MGASQPHLVKDDRIDAVGCLQDGAALDEQTVSCANACADHYCCGGGEA